MRSRVARGCAPENIRPQGRRPGHCLALATGVLALLVLGAGLASAQEDPELSDGTVEAEVRVGDDQRIAARLAGLFESIESLERARVEVEEGVVRLRGSVASAAAREMAGALAKKVEGVVAVENALEEDRSITTRMRLALGRLASRGQDLLAQLPLLGVALAAASLLWLLGRLATRWDAVFAWVAPNPFIADLARQVVRLGFAVAGLLVALEILDATALMGAVLGAAGVVSLALGFALRDLVENYIASVLLSLRQPFLPHDHVKMAGYEGLVARLTSRATVLLTLDGNHVRIPNSLVFKGVIENFTRKPERRFSFTVGLGVDEDIVGAQDLGNRILEGMPGVLDAPPPLALVDELGDSSVALRFCAWVDQREADFNKVRSEAIRLVKQAFDREQIEMPEPIHRLRFAGAPDAEQPVTPTRAPRSDAARDVSPDNPLEDDVNEERVEAGGDLLEAGGPQE